MQAPVINLHHYYNQNSTGVVNNVADFHSNSRQLTINRIGNNPPGSRGGGGSGGGGSAGGGGGRRGGGGGSGGGSGRGGFGGGGSGGGGSGGSGPFGASYPFGGSSGEHGLVFGSKNSSLSNENMYSHKYKGGNGNTYVYNIHINNGPNQPIKRRKLLNGYCESITAPPPFEKFASNHVQSKRRRAIGMNTNQNNTQCKNNLVKRQINKTDLMLINWNKLKLIKSKTTNNSINKCITITQKKK
eukprot:129999_1